MWNCSPVPEGSECSKYRPVAHQGEQRPAGAPLDLPLPLARGPFRLRPGELRGWFEDWKILFYSEVHPAARILVRKTGF